MLSYHAKCSLPVAVRVSKTGVLKLPIVSKAMLSDVKTALAFTPTLKRIEITKQFSRRRRFKSLRFKAFLN